MYVIQKLVKFNSVLRHWFLTGNVLQVKQTHAIKVFTQVFTQTYEDFPGEKVHTHHTQMLVKFKKVLLAALKVLNDIVLVVRLVWSDLWCNLL